MRVSTALFTLFGLVVGGISAVGEHRSSSSVLELNERFLEVKNEGHWFVEFYAPWCGHCKRLHPIWEQVGHALESSGVRVGRVDCTRFTSVSSSVGITGFPTIKYFRNGDVYEYTGDRTKEALLDFAWKVLGPEVRRLNGLGQFQEAQGKRKGSGFFLLVTDDDAQDSLSVEYEETAKSMLTKAYFYAAGPDSLPPNIQVHSLPAVLCFKDKSHVTYNPKSREGRSLKEWVNEERWPLFPEITFGTLYEIGLCCNKLLVISMLDKVQRGKADSDVRRFSNLVEETASEYKDKLHGKFQFGWTDGHELGDNIVLGTMKVPSILVFNASSYQFFLPEDPPSVMTPDSLALWLEHIAAGNKPALGGRGFIQRLKRMFFDIFSTLHSMFSTQPLLSCCLFGLPLGLLAIVCYTLCSTDASVETEEIYPESEESEDEDHEKRE